MVTAAQRGRRARLLGVDPTATRVGAAARRRARAPGPDGRAWCAFNCPYDGLADPHRRPRAGLAAARRHRGARRRPDPPRRRSTSPVEQVAVSIRSGRGRARLDRERSDLVATVAHELRSPLTGVKGFVQALLNRWDKLNDDQKKLMLTTVSADSDRLSRLIAELLDVARIDTGRLQLYPRPVDAAVLVGRVVDSVGAGTSRPIELDVADDLPEITVDPDKFTQVVTNLVENAVRHGEGTVRGQRVDRRTPCRRPAHGRGRGRGHRARAAAPGVHEVLEAAARAAAPGWASTSSTAW